MLSRLLPVRDLAEALQVALRDLIALHGAEMGDVQLTGQTGDLVIVEAQVVSREFLETFRRVSVDSDSACGRAARDRRTVFIPDVAADSAHAPYRAFAATVPFRSVLSCPLMASCGRMLGMISALSAQSFAPTPLEMQAATAYGDALAGVVARELPALDLDLEAWAERRAADLLESTAWRLPRLVTH